MSVAGALLTLQSPDTSALRATPTREWTCHRPKGPSQVATNHGREPALMARILGTLWTGHEEPGLPGLRFQASSTPL